MQLSFLGHSYQVHHPQVKVAETAETATFMGPPYARKQYQVKRPQQPPEELTFMGQRYVRAEKPQPLPCKPRPGEKVMNSRLMLKLRRSRAGGKRHPAFRGR